MTDPSAPAPAAPMSYADCYRAIAEAIPGESFALDVETWHHGQLAGNVVNITWKLWLSTEVQSLSAASASALVDLVRRTVALRKPAEAPADVEAVGLIPETAHAPDTTTPAPAPAAGEEMPF